MSQEKTGTPGRGGFSSLLGKLKDAVLEEEKPRAVVPAKAATTSTAASPAPATATGTSGNPMVGSLMTMVLDKTTAYTALLEAITPLEGFIPDEASRYKAAFAIVGKTRTVEQIVQAIDMQHMQALDAECQRFNGQARNKEDTDVNARLAEIDSLKAQVASGEEEIVRIQQQAAQRIQALQAAAVEKKASMERMEADVAKTRAQINEVNGRFNEAASIVKARLQQARASVLAHLSA